MLWSYHEGVEISQGWGYDYSRGHDVRSSLQLVMSFSVIWQIQYSGSSNTEHLNLQPIPNQSILKIGIWMVHILNAQSTFAWLCIRPTVQKQSYYIGIQDSCHLEWSGYLDLERHLNIEPFNIRTTFDHLYTKYVQYSSPYCIVLLFVK